MPDANLWPDGLNVMSAGVTGCESFVWCFRECGGLVQIPDLSMSGKNIVGRPYEI